MPVYEHYCQGCDTITENITKIADRKEFIICPDCGSHAERIISQRGAFQSTEPLWLDSAVENLKDGAVDHVRDRQDFNRYLKEHGIIQRG